MPVNLSVKNVPDALAERLRSRAKHNHRSLQQELLSILESAAAERNAQPSSRTRPGDYISIDELVARTRQLFPEGTASSAAFIRAMRDGR